jgi:outer membrane receptor protein involved in Fe transport
MTLTPNKLRAAILSGLLASNIGLPVMSIAAETTSTSTHQVQTYAITAGSLTEALLQFAAQANITIQFDPALTDGLRSSALNGQFSVEQGLAALIQDPSLAIVAKEGKVYTLKATNNKEATVLDTIVIYGDRSVDILGESSSSIAIVNDENLASPVNQTMRDAFKRMVNVNDGNFAESGFIIRGVNSEGLTPGGAGAPLASFYIDGVQQTIGGTRRGARGLFDTEQLEVYRGPQSTLSGRNALAGAIYLRTKDPEFAESGRAQITYGENNHKQMGLAYGNALSDNLAFRISGEWSQKDSDINYPSYEQYSSFDDFAMDEYYQVRGKLLWLPVADSDTTRVLFSYSHAFDSPEYNNIAGPDWHASSPSYDDRRGDVWGALTPAWSPVPLPVFEEARTTTVDNFGMQITHDINNNLMLTTMTGLSQSTTKRDSINEGTPGESMVTQGAFDQQILAQEVRLNYDSGLLRWVAGAYAAKEENDAWRNSRRSSYQQSTNSADITNLALFGDFSYEFISDWRVLAGSRVDYIDKKQHAFFAVDGTVSSDTSNSFDDLVFIPKLGIEHQLNENNTLSLIYQEGYRAGGSGIRSTDGFVYSYDPEETQNLELSWRGSFLQDRLDVTANIFYQKWQDQQVEIRFDPGVGASGYVVNAGESESYGMEANVNYVASDMLNIYAAVGLLKTEFKDFIISTENYKGLSFANAPETSIALGFHWGNGSGWFGGGSAKYVSSSTSRLEGGVDSLVTLKSHTTVDAEAGYAWGKTKLTAYAINVFDEEFFTYEFGPNSLATLGERREIGMRLDYAF